MQHSIRQLILSLFQPIPVPTLAMKSFSSLVAILSEVKLNPYLKKYVMLFFSCIKTPQILLLRNF